MNRDNKKLEAEDIRSTLNLLSAKSDGAGLSVLSRLIEIARDQADDEISMLRRGGEDPQIDIDAMRRQGVLLSEVIEQRKKVHG